MAQYYKEMPWFAMPYKDERFMTLKNAFKVRGYPRLLAFKADGKLLDSDAKDEVMDEGPELIE